MSATGFASKRETSCLRFRAPDRKGEGPSILRQNRGAHLPAFVIRHNGAPRAYLNQCAHMSVELDWQEGEFFDTDKNYLMCATHGALYYPDTGACAYGRCNSRGLIAIDVSETGGEILLNGENGIHLTTEPPEPEMNLPDG